MLVKKSVNLVRYKDLFLGVRQYDSRLLPKHCKKLMDIAYNSQLDPSKPGFQTFLTYMNDPSVDAVKKSFLDCCRDYFKVGTNDQMKMWFYQDWKSNPCRTGQTWHNHADDDCYALSGVLYLNLPRGCDTTSFALFGDIMKLPSLLYKWFIYPSMLPHLPGSWGKTDERRICIAADYWFPVEGR